MEKMTPEQKTERNRLLENYSKEQSRYLNNKTGDNKQRKDNAYDRLMEFESRFI